MSDYPDLELADGTEVKGHVGVEACRHDPNLFIEYVLDVEQCPVHYEIQDHYTEHDSCYVEEHRGVGKTVQTIGRCAWEIGRSSLINKGKLDGVAVNRIKYVQVNDGESSKSVDLCRQIIESPRFKHVFPDIEPDPTCWGKTAFRVLGGRMERDPTMQACGIFGHAGGRCEMFVFDDVCDLENAIRKAALREQVKEAYLNTWLPMLTGARKRNWRISTCWHVDDITAMWRKQCAEDGTLMRNPVVDYCSRVYDPAIEWSHSFSPEGLRWWEEQLGGIGYARAFELKPVSAEQLIFDPAWLERAYVEEIPREHVPGGRCVGMMDFAFTDASQKGDPDWSVCLVGWTHPKGHCYATGMHRAKQTFPDFADAALAKLQRADAREATAEGNGPQLGLVQQLNRTWPIPVTPLPRLTDKVLRATEVQAFIKGGRFHVLSDRSSGVLLPIPELRHMVDELVTFPAAGHDDTVDTVIDLCNYQSLRTRGAAGVAKVDGKAGRAAYGTHRDRTRDRVRSL